MQIIKILLWCIVLVTIHQLFPYNNMIEKRLIIVVTSYNNKDWYIKNLDSIFCQNYHNYFVIYIDDKSSDNTGNLIEEYITEHHLEDKILLIKNNTWQSQMANHYKAVHLCNDWDIVVHIDGDDWLNGTEVFNIINKAYSEQDIWLTYGTPVRTPSGIRWPGMAPDIMFDVIKNNKFREVCWEFSHLRTFYAWLFKLIKLQDLMFKSTFKLMSPAPDVAFLTPLCELAGFHSYAIPEVVYMYNEKNPISQYKICAGKTVENLLKTIFSWPKYLPLEKPYFNIKQHYEQAKADLLIVCDTTTNFEELSYLIQSCSALTGLNNILIVGERSQITYFEKLQNDYHNVICIPYDSSCTLNTFLAQATHTMQNHILVSNSHIKLQKTFNISHCIQELERTFAYYFLISLDSNKQDLQDLSVLLEEDLIALQPQYITSMSNNYHPLGIILYRKKDLTILFNQQCSVPFNRLLTTWKRLPIPDRAVGLLFKQTKIVG